MDDYEREMGVPLNIYSHRKIIFSNRDDKGQETNYNVNELAKRNDTIIKDLPQLFAIGDNFWIVSATQTASTFFMKIDSQFSFCVEKKLDIKEHAFLNIKYVHELESYYKMYKNKASNLNQTTPESEIFNVVGQLQSLERIKQSGELENNTEKKEQITYDEQPKHKI